MKPVLAIMIFSIFIPSFYAASWSLDLPGDDGLFVLKNQDRDALAFPSDAHCSIEWDGFFIDSLGQGVYSITDEDGGEIIIFAASLEETLISSILNEYGQELDGLVFLSSIPLIESLAGVDGCFLFLVNRPASGYQEEAASMGFTLSIIPVGSLMYMQDGLVTTSAQIRAESVSCPCCGESFRLRLSPFGEVLYIGR
ncbi:MAG TPA: hypothetical protein IAA76_04030 [Candidatus Ornithospirochaeta stercorigallinarum]|nr:hypothetical protein [Candidatus Ornithospirochaeta stercorigallinarum]